MAFASLVKPSGDPDQKVVPPVKLKNWVTSLGFFVIALAKSKRIGPSGDAQIRDTPADVRMSGVSPPTVRVPDCPTKLDPVQGLAKQ